MSVEPILSEREREILELVATGASNKEIAQRLVISPNTVKVHLRNIFSKIGVVSRTEATLYAIRENLVPQVGQVNGVVGDGGAQAAQPLVWYRQLRFQIALAVSVLIIMAAAIFLSAGGRQILFPPTAVPLQFTQPERWVKLSDLPEPSVAAAIVQYENSIFMIGGTFQGGATNRVFRYDAASDTWIGQADKPTAVSGAEAGVIGEKIFVPGGLDNNGQPVDSLEVFDPRANVWSEATQLPLPLSYYGLAVFEGRLFLFGGWDGKEVIDRVFVYNPIEDQWSELNPMDKAFGGAAAVVSGTKIYLIGGTDGTNFFSDLRVYFPNREAAGEPAWETRAPLPEPEVGNSAVALVNGLYTTGGTHEGAGNFKMYRYDEQSNNWAILEDAPVVIGSEAELVTLDTKIHILGGSVDGSPQATHLAYQAVYTVLIPAISR